MQIFKTRLFDRWANTEGVSDQALMKAAAEINEGLVDAALGGNVYKKRVAKPGQGKSGGYRTILAFKIKDKAFFMYGFAAVLSISARLLTSPAANARTNAPTFLPKNW